MSINFKATERVNPRDITLPRKYYPQIVNGDDVTFDELADLISKVSNLNYGQIMGALGSLIEIIELQLRHGRQVHLNTLGTFYLTLSGKGKENADELTSDDINKARIRFRPGKRLRKMVKNLDFDKVSNDK